MAASSQKIKQRIFPENNVVCDVEQHNGEYGSMFHLPINLWQVINGLLPNFEFGKRIIESEE